MGEPIYVTGHRNPDTDSIVAAIAYASLRNALGDRDYLAARIGGVSDQTQLVLDKFGFKAPMLLHNVRTQVRDLSYDVPPILSGAVTIHHAWELLRGADANTVSMPVTDEEGRLYGMLTSGDMATYEMEFVESARVEGIPLFNLLSNLDGQLFADSGKVSELSGELVIALPGVESRFRKCSIVLMGNQPELFRAAVDAGACCIIICQADVDRALLTEAGDTLVVSTPYDAYRAARLVIQALPVSRICHTENLVQFHLNDYLDDVREATLKTRYRSYPIVDEDEKVVGTLSRYHLLRPNRKRVVLVDHNEMSQSVPGLEQAEILEIIDHHRLADVQTAAPVYMRNEPVGSTCTIVTAMFQESGIMPSPKLAGLLAAGIVSDTILFKSPTSTERDRILAERMARHAGISLAELGKEIFAVSIATHDPKELLFSDFKRFEIAGHSLGIGQVTCLDSNAITPESRERLIDLMHKELRSTDFDSLLLMLTDVLREGTELLVVGEADSVEQAFNVTIKDHAAFLPGVISRKKQIVPMLSAIWG